MVILLPSSSTILASKARVSSSHPTSLPASLSCFLSLRSTLRRPPPLVLVNSSKTRRAVAELVDDNEESSAVSSSSSELGNSRTFLDARSVEGISALSYALYVSAYLLSVIQREKEAGRLPLNVAQGMEELYHNYRDAVFQRGDPKACEIFLSNMAVALDRIFMVVKEPFVFSPYHKAIREPFDYYKFGQKYIRPLIDFRSSYVGNISLFNDIEEKLRQKICRNFTEGRFISVELVFLYHKIKGDSVVLIANHQTEADPAVIALLLESTNPDIAEGMTYIAGDRVVTDPLCKPFSMGRNLLCVYSKKHMGDDPELIEMKKRSNIRSLKEMAMLLRCGSKIIWIAPSGGRDRPDPVTKEWLPAPFDASSVDNMRRLVEHAGVPGHIYPLALLCHDIMRPPAQVEKEIGERRVIGFHGTGLSVAPPINFHEIAAACEDPEEVKEAYTQVLYDSIHQQYGVLKSAIHGKQGLEASIPPVSLSQPWN